jgi:hypothetical protein
MKTLGQYGVLVKSSDEQVQDDTCSPTNDSMTWVPALVT